jgi:hypothetical protein
MGSDADPSIDECAVIDAGFLTEIEVSCPLPSVEQRVAERKASVKLFSQLCLSLQVCPAQKLEKLMSIHVGFPAVHSEERTDTIAPRSTATISATGD